MVKHTSFSSEVSKGIFLLGQKQSNPSYFQSYRQLMERCAEDGEFLSYHTSQEWLVCYEKDAQHLHTRMPLLVFRPHTIASIAPFIQVCYELALPITTRCGGTGLAGSCVPSKEGVVLLTGHLKKIKEYDRIHGILCVEPGVTIRQIKRQIASDFWKFPLNMATEGVAGIAGCLSSNSRGYHQQARAVLDAIEQVVIIDGQGQTLEVPGALMCGAEGLWGVIVELKIKLKKKSYQRLEFTYHGSWQNALAKLPLLHSLQVLDDMAWFNDGFHLGIEGESWRLPSAVAYLENHLPGIQKKLHSIDSIEQPNPAFLPSQINFVVISTIFHSLQLPEACTCSLQLAQRMQLECLQMADVLAGSLHLILQSKNDLYSFKQNIESFLVEWACFVDDAQGAIGSCHGVGMQLRAFMPPFWTEETQAFWRKIQFQFDPKNLYGQERFYPGMNTSLEKVRV